MPETNARPHSGSYSRRFCGGPVAGSAPSSGGIIAARWRSIGIGISVGIARIRPSQSPIDHWSPSHLFQAAKTGPMACPIPCPIAGVVSQANSGGSSQTAARIWPGFAYAESQAESTPPEDSPLTRVGRPITRSMKRTRSLPKLSSVYRPGVHVERPCPRRSTAWTWKCSASRPMAAS